MNRKVKNGVPQSAVIVGFGETLSPKYLDIAMRLSALGTQLYVVTSDQASSIREQRGNASGFNDLVQGHMKSLFEPLAMTVLPEKLLAGIVMPLAQGGRERLDVESIQAIDLIIIDDEALTTRTQEINELLDQENPKIGLGTIQSKMLPIMTSLIDFGTKNSRLVTASIKDATTFVENLEKKTDVDEGVLKGGAVNSSFFARCAANAKRIVALYHVAISNGWSKLAGTEPIAIAAEVEAEA